jgi:8-oxo-dGTP pyrophosphatase MutT (NUDIX family)
MSDAPRLRHAVRVLLLDERDQVLLFRGEEPETGRAFWFPAGGGLEEGEDVHSAAVREVTEETGLADVALGPEVWRRRHVFTWRGIQWDQRERWFMARVVHFEPDGAARTEAETEDLTACRWWTVVDLQATTDDLVPRDLAALLVTLLADGPPPIPIDVGV